MENGENAMINAERFEDALTELAKDRTVGHAGDQYAYMAGYLFSLVREMARESDLAERILVRSLHSTEQMLFKSNEMREVDSLA